MHTLRTSVFGLALLFGPVWVAQASSELAASPTSLDFGSLNVNSSSTAQTVTFSNNYVSTLPISSIELVVTGLVLSIAHPAADTAADFTITGNTCFATGATSATLDPAQSCSVSIIFNPQAIGARTSNLQIAFSVSGVPSTLMVPLSGTGTAITSGLTFVSVTPCRVFDTRNANGAFGGPIMAGATQRNFIIPNSTCGIPSTAVAYSVNVTTVPAGILGYLAIWPSGHAQPVVSTLNSDGRVKANAAIVPAGTNGGISVYVSNDSHVILDINGYFESNGGASGLFFYPMTPCRIADTRGATAPLAGPYLTGGQGRTFPILSSTCNVPVAAQAYSLNFTAIPHVPLGYLATWPSGQTKPLVSTLNASTAAVTANAAIVPAGTSGSIDVYASDDADVVIDINGYFAPAGTGGLALYTMTPCRLLDSRWNSGAPITGSLPTSVTGTSCGAPAAAAKAFVLNATVVPAVGLGFLSMWPDGASQPLVSTLNASDSAVTSNMAIVPTTNGSVDVYASNSTHVILDIASYFAP